MSGDQGPTTRLTLLLRLRDWKDTQAWEEFLESYAPGIFTWCKKRSLQEADAADITQEVLGKLVQAIRSFQYNPAKGSFRGWLKTVTHNAIHDLVRNWRRAKVSDRLSEAEAQRALTAPTALDELTEAVETQARLEMLREAESLVRLRVQPQTWRAYHETAKEQKPAAEVAERIGMRVAEVYVARSRVLRMIRSEIASMDPSALDVDTRTPQENNPK